MLAHFLALICGMSADEATRLWHCLPGLLRQQIAYRVERLASRRPYGQTGDREARNVLAVMPPQALILALEAAVETGQVPRQTVVAIEEKLFAEMTASGEWR